MASLPEADYPAEINLPFEYIPGVALEIEIPVTDSTGLAVDWTGVGAFTAQVRPSAAPPYSPDATVRLAVDVTVPTPTNGVITMTLAADRTSVMDGPSRQMWAGMLTLAPLDGGSPFPLLLFTLQRRGGIWGVR